LGFNLVLENIPAQIAALCIPRLDGRLRRRTRVAKFRKTAISRGKNGI